jgi:hypothetical protein
MSPYQAKQGEPFELACTHRHGSAYALFGIAVAAVSFDHGFDENPPYGTSTVGAYERGNNSWLLGPLPMCLPVVAPASS